MFSIRKSALSVAVFGSAYLGLMSCADTTDNAAGSHEGDAVAPSTTGATAETLGAEAESPSLEERQQVDVECDSDCEVTLITLAVVQDSAGPYVLVPDARFAISSVGSIFMGAPATEGVVVQLNADGTYRRTIGATGSGPGETRVVTGLAIANADTLLVMDATLRRMNRYDASGGFIDQYQLPGGIRKWTPLSGSMIAVSGNIPTRGSSGFPLHLLDRGTLRFSFGDDTTTFGRGQVSAFNRHLAPALHGHIWVARRFPYRIELFSSDGKFLRAISRDVSWFPDKEYVSVGGPQVAPPPPQITGLFDDQKGGLWVYLLVPDAEWRPGHRETIRSGVHAGDTRPETVLDPFFDTIIERIDAASGGVTHHVRDRRALLPVGSGHLVSYSEVDGGVPRYEILAHRLQGKTRSSR